MKLLISFVLLSVLVLTSTARSEIANEAEMERVCRNWLSLIVHENGTWAGATDPRIDDVRVITGRNGAILGRSYSIAPSGFVVVPVLKELPPVKAYFDEYALDVEQPQGIPLLLRDVLESRAEIFIRTYGDMNAVQPPVDGALFGTRHRQEWDRFSEEPGQFVKQLDSGDFAPMLGAGPLLTTSWEQGPPYNNQCPLGDGGRCVVGCVATAVVQVMKYHEWPPRGTGRPYYVWNGDQSCGGHAGGGELSVDCSDLYDWANMPDICGWECSPVQKEALAELCYEVGVAFRMDYGACGSGTATSYALDALPKYFGYDPRIDEERRRDHSPASWFDVIQADINAGRPMLYSIIGESMGHAIVCDGWRTVASLNQCHINYGWGGALTSWYTLDDISCPWDCEPMNDELIRNIKPFVPKTWRIKPDRTGDAPTIQAGIDAAVNSETVLLASGTYTGDGNRDIYFRGKAITVRSESGNPDSCVIDCAGSLSEPHRGFLFQSGEDSHSVLEGVTIKNGDGVLYGGGIHCYASSPTIERCVFLNNRGVMEGGGIHCDASSPTISDCVFHGNTCCVGGGGVRLCDSSGIISGCTFIGNRTYNEGGSGISLEGSSSAVVEKTIIAFGTGSPAVWCEEGSNIVLECCDIYGNSGGDWVGCIAGLVGIDGNLSTNPLFCDLENGDLALAQLSCCLPHNNVCGVLIGARGLGCAEPTGIGNVSERAPRLSLAQNYPNPFNSATTIPFAQTRPALVVLEVYDAQGRLVRSLKNEIMPRGLHEVVWDGRDANGQHVATGVYFVRLKSGADAAARQIVVIR